MSSKIIRFTAENFKKLSVVEITPQGNIVEITGKNGQGKSSVLDAIFYAIVGGEMPGKPIRTGEEAASIKLEIGGAEVELIVERRFNAKGSTVTVRTASGATKASPQGILNALTDKLALDPLEVLRMKPKEQVDALKSLVKLEINIDELDGQNKTDYDRRTDVRREALQLRAQASAVKVPAGLPDAPIDEQAIIDDLTGAGEFNANRDGLAREQDAARENIATLLSDIAAAQAALPHEITEIESKRDEAIAALRQKIEEAKRAIAEMEGQIEATQAGAVLAILGQTDSTSSEIRAAQAQIDETEKMLAEAAVLPEPKDATAIRARLLAAQTTNAGIKARDELKRLATAAETKEAEVTVLTEAMAARDKVKADAIAAAKMPIEGLSFGDGAVLFNGIPLDQASDAERIRVSMAIAMAGNPELRVIRIREGSLLDDDSMALIAEVAAAQDYQVWIERINPSGPVGFELEDGHIKAAPAKPATGDLLA